MNPNDVNAGRRTFLKTAAVGTLAAGAAAASATADDAPLIVDVHQHLWDLAKLKLPWLAEAPEILKKTYHLAEYAEATRGLNIKAVYMEVDVAADQKVDEAEHVIELSRSGKNPTIAAVIGGRPNEAAFGEYVKRFKGSPYVKGIRRVLHNPEIPKGFCLEEQFVKNIRLLGESKLSFDLCMRPTDLDDALKLTELCPDTRFILDHCGNADPLVFRQPKDGDKKPTHTVDGWKSAIERLSKRPNLICKISGIIARLPEEGDAKDLAPIVNHCLDTFGPDRVVFGSDWPVCLLGRPLKTWVEYLKEIIAPRPAADQRKLWSENAVKQYGLKV